VLLAQLPPETARELLVQGGMPARTELTVTDPDELLRQLPAIADLGYAVDDGEQETGVRCVAVPVPGGAAAGAISVSGPAGRLGLDAVPRAVPLLQSAAAALATELGRDGGRPAG
jgi:IclR family acetate operon transcriptional repressor